MLIEKSVKIKMKLKATTVEKLDELAERYNFTREWYLENFVNYFEEFILGNIKNVVEYPEYYITAEEYVGMCTHLKDISDKNIYEGDILSCSGYFGQTVIGVVIFDKGAFMFHEVGTHRDCDVTLCDFLINECKITGNVRNTPELLRKVN